MLGTPPAPSTAAGPDLEDLLWDLQIVPLGPQAAPGLALDDLTGTRVTLEGLRGRAVLLYFWESG